MNQQVAANARSSTTPQQHTYVSPSMTRGHSQHQTEQEEQTGEGVSRRIAEYLLTLHGLSVSLLILRCGISAAADLINLAAISSTRECGGPNIPFYAGRADATIADPAGRFAPSDANATVVKAAFLRMGMTVRDAVALSGAHTVGGMRFFDANLTRVEFVPFDSTPDVFDNQIFKEILDGTATQIFNLDLANDPETRPIVEEFAKNQNAFFKQYVESYTKMMQLGAPSLESMTNVDTTTLKKYAPCR
ncbi:L-ascorbate peroxidase 3 [Quaeritorhiza haematococci]|nr:L-ascorbate peroxidase 3 [Quaeritorhiza haematococci]